MAKEAAVRNTSDQITSLPALVDRAVNALANARTAAEVLEARDLAAIAYDIAKKTGRLAKAKQAHDDLIGAVYRAQADALEIEAQAKRRLADEYDAAQERGEIRTSGERSFSDPEKLSGTEIIPPKELHEARLIRDAEKADPGIVSRTVTDALAAGEEPTRAQVRRAALKAKKSKPKKRPRRPAPAPESPHDRDLQMLRNVWGAACASAQQAFLRELTS